MRRATPLLVIVWSLACTSCYRLHYSSYKDANVKAVTIQPMFLIFPSAHADGFRQDVKVNGRTYRDVRGLDPCYINVPAIGCILFVTGNNVRSAQATVYLFNLATKQMTQVDAGHSPFGSYIGWSGPYPRGATNYVASADSNGLVLVTEYDEKRVTEYLDLRNKRLEKSSEENLK
jgi:hypothetical protein